MLPVRAAITLGILTVWGLGCAQQQANGIFDANSLTNPGADGGEDADADGGDADVIDESDGSDGLDIVTPPEDLGNPTPVTDSGTYVPVDIGSGGTDTGTHRDSGTGTGTSSCSGHTACGTCTAASNCGWCGTSNTCEAGTVAGPSSGTCGQWAWAATQCSTTGTGTGTGTSGCSAYATCGSCDMILHCGWCASTNTCIPGTATAPTSGSCSNWQYHPAQCSTTGTGSTDPCNAMASTCTDCGATATCGWCGATNTCVTSNASGTGPATGSCPASQWALVPLDCP